MSITRKCWSAKTYFCPWASAQPCTPKRVLLAIICHLDLLLMITLVWRLINQTHDMDQSAELLSDTAVSTTVIHSPVWHPPAASFHPPLMPMTANNPSKITNIRSCNNLVRGHFWWTWRLARCGNLNYSFRTHFCSIVWCDASHLKTLDPTYTEFKR